MPAITKSNVSVISVKTAIFLLSNVSNRILEEER